MSSSLAVAVLLLVLVSPWGQAPLSATQSHGIWLDVPFVKQTENGCGSAAIAMLLQYWGARGSAMSREQVDEAAIQKELYSRKEHGILAADIERYLREAGFREFAIAGTWDDLRQQLTAGRPMILSIRPAEHARLHYVVVTGMDFTREALFLNDPARGKLLRVERQELEKEWSAARNWMLLAVPAQAN